MLNNIKKFTDNSQTLKESRENVKERSIIIDILIFIGLFLLLYIGTIGLNIVLDLISMAILPKVDVYWQLMGLFGFIFIPILVYIIVKKFEKRSFRSVGFSKDNILPSVLRGLGIGFLMFLTVVIIGLISGQYKYTGYNLSSLILLVPFLLGFFVQSLGEEFEMRGWAMTYIYKRHSIIAAIIISNILFSMAHIFNSGIDLLPIINIFLVGVFFAILFIKYDNIWICGSAHAAWNFSQGILFGFNVSGQTTPSLLKFSQVSENIIGGGTFGPESGLIATFVIIIGLFLSLYIKENKT
ncbi:CPBP family intramembrane glutamic endopeptidase [uncultured Methanobrevibacter sp.]|uniref:CPBP family intramembrane glutamic endopeptidase n=1 Tax=uncultured Methanobrevibacter sp. TaxID=253161 RepID=UPI0025E192B4|nr:type II CAAX endopeptidase family protein [uncultured Methanobrevibacter sp.]